MARNKKPIQQLPEASSDSDEPHNNSDDSDSETPTVPVPFSDAQHDAEDSDDAKSESDTNSDSDHPSNFTIKPIQTKQQELVKATKRPAEGEPESAVKKSKVDEDGVTKGSAIQRLFSKEDEVALLEGIIEFQAKKGLDAYSDISKFHDFIKKNIHFEVTPNQLKEKIRRLKSKYVSFVKKNGEDAVITKPHESKLYNLSKTLWGASNVAESEKSKKPNKQSEGGGITLALASKGNEVASKKPKKAANGGGKIKKEVGQSEGGEAEEQHMVVDEKEDFSAKFPLCAGVLMELEGLSERTRTYWVDNLRLIEKAKLEECEQKLHKIKCAELELFIQKNELMGEQLRLIRDASKSLQ